MRNLLNETFRRIVTACNSKIINKLLIFIISVVVVLIASLTFISYFSFQRESERNTITNTSNNLKLVNNDLMNYFTVVNHFTLPDNTYDNLINSLMNESGDFDSQVYLEDFISTLFYERNDISGIYLYIISQKKCYYIFSSDTFGGVRIEYDNTIPAQPWYNKVMKSGGKYFEPIFSTPNTSYKNNGESILAFHRTYANISDSAPLAVISVFFNKSGIGTILNGIPMQKGEHLIYLNSDNIPYYYDDKSIYDSLKSSGGLERVISARKNGTYTWRIGGKKYLAVYNVMDGGSGKLVKFMPYDLIYEKAKNNKNWNLAIGALFLGISVFLVILITRAITKPLDNLSKKMIKFSEGDFNVTGLVTGQDEIAQLEWEFNKMVIKINELINERYKMKLIEKNAVLKALEAEVNPHFLYNALQAISTKALKHGATDVSDMVDALALSFRYCISGEDMVKISDEIRHIENYLVLQKARYGRRLSVEYDLDEKVLLVKIPKMSIQTLVENSIKHAIEKVYNDLTITIHVRSQECGTMISVSDNGPGIQPDRLVQILWTIENDCDDFTSKSIGLKNLNSRLMLIFGSKSKISIRTDEKGVEISFFVPPETE